MLRKTLLALAQAAVLVAATAAPAHAALFTGSCAIEVRFDFESPIFAADGAPDYKISLVGAVDLDSSTSGRQACATTLDTFEPLRKTNGAGTGDSTTWTCTSAFSSGSWEQQFWDASGAATPPPILGSHRLVGSWDNWTMEVVNPSLTYVGVAELTLTPAEKLRLADACTRGTLSLTMTGVMVFQDP